MAAPRDVPRCITAVHSNGMVDALFALSALRTFSHHGTERAFVRDPTFSNGAFSAFLYLSFVKLYVTMLTVFVKQGQSVVSRV